MSADKPPEEFKYWAFICYSHTDQKWADWLHKSLETYQIPKHVVGKRTREGIIPRRLFPVFRDREELPGSAKLGEEIEAALRKSRFLIVICSPRAVASKWVDQEIRIFKALGREDRVLCLVVEGEPHATTRPEVREPECLPESVRFWVDAERSITPVPTEPIAADVRKGKDGKKNAQLKLLAGILGVEYDSLKQRDEERRQRQQQVMLAGSVGLLIIFSLLIAQFYKQTQEAVEARNEALNAQGAAERAQKEARESEALAKQAREQAVAAAIKADEKAQEALESKARAEEQAKLAYDAETKEKAAKEDALKQTLVAEAARQKAVTNEMKMQRTLAVSDFTTAARLIEEGNEPKALAYLSRALRYDPENPAVVSRVISLLSHKTWGLPIMRSLKHEEEVKGVLFSHDGDRIITLSENAVRVWNKSTAELAYPPLEHGAQITSMQLSDDGLFLITASKDRTAQVWELQTGKKVGNPLNHGDQVLWATFSPDRRLVATGCDDKTVRIWETASGKAVHTFKHSNPVKKVQFTPDGGSVVSLDLSGARRWDLRTGQPVGLPMTHEGGLEQLCISPNGKWIATGSSRSARVWNAITGEPVTKPLSHENWVTGLEFSPDELQLLTASSDNNARLWNIPSGELAVPPMHHQNEVTCARFSPNGRWLVTAGIDGTARIWNANNGVQIVEALNHSIAVRDARFSPDGKHVVTCSADRTVKLWEITSGRPAVEPLRHEQQVNSACFSPDGTLVATVSDDRTARIWNVISAKAATEPLRHKGAVIAAAFSPNGKFLATGSADGTAQIWDAESGKQIFAEALQHNSWVNSVSFSPDGKWLVTASEDRRARVWDIATGTLVYEPLRHEGIVKSATFSPDGKWIITASFDKNVRVWNADTREAISPTMQHQSLVRAAALSPDGKWVITGSDDKTARVWDPSTGQLLIPPLPHDGPVDIVAFTPQTAWADKKWIITVSDKVARVWDATSGKAITEPLKHDQPIRTASFGPHGNLLVTATGKTVRLWETSSGRLVTEPLEHEKEVRSVAFSPDGNFVVTTSSDQSARIWLATLRGKAPQWFSELADAVGGYKLDNSGAAEVFSGSWKNFTSIREELDKASANDPFAIWTRWFLADRTSRTISAFSTTELDDYAKLRVLDGKAEEALDFQPNNCLALLQTARLAKEPSRAEFLSKLAEQYEPQNPEVLWLRAQILQQLGKTTAALAVMERAITLDPRNVLSFGPGGIEFTNVRSEGTGASGWLPLGWQDFSDSKMAYSKVLDTPAASVTALEMQMELAQGRGELRGPRFVCKRNGKFVVEGWVRSATKTDLNVVLNQFVEPYQKYKEQVIHTTPEWKPFKVFFSSAADIAAELRLQQSTKGAIQLAGVTVRQD